MSVKKKTIGLHVELPEPLHKNLRIRAAYDGTSLKELVIKALEKILDEASEKEGGKINAI